MRLPNVCELMGADVHHVARAMGLDGRIGKKFLHPGRVTEAPVFQRYPGSFEDGHEKGYLFRVLEAVIQVNDEQGRG